MGDEVAVKFQALRLWAPDDGVSVRDADVNPETARGFEFPDHYLVELNRTWNMSARAGPYKGVDILHDRIRGIGRDYNSQRLKFGDSLESEVEDVANLL